MRTPPQRTISTTRDEYTAELVARTLNEKQLAFACAFGYEQPPGTPLPQLGAATTIANDADLAAARVGFHVAFMQALEQETDPLAALYQLIEHRGSSLRINWLGDLPGFEEWTADRRLAGGAAFKLDVVAKKWANGIRVKNDDLRYNAAVKMQVGELARKARRHLGKIVIETILNGFDGLAFPERGTGLAYDGAFYFADNHLGGNDNKLTGALASGTLATAEQMLASMTTYDGSDPLELRGTHLIVGPSNEHTALKLITQELLAGGESNVHKGRYEVIVSPRITGAHAAKWFLADLSRGIKPVVVHEADPIKTGQVAGPNTVPGFISDESWFGAQASYESAAFEFRTIVGSTGV